ncbi:hypothetical protein FHR22_001885 [Sphingopyxis panaciterrae]|uniref:hypothetical protein n=1 Tax=Sphingopyxis panaciterrae TaxID=363841 RepID=UPI0014219D92|nr:hypothetical protein [Sphingopyxis panaciterrae]NIJ37201.1 hypothetical protein [Sphingopyxis panaciterrae]
MQFDPLRAFPYPVLRPGSSDYIDSSMQTVAELIQSDDQLEITAEATIAIAVEEIRALVEAGKARYAAVISCRDTYFRKAMLSEEPQLSERFPTGALRGEVLICPYVVAVEDIDGFVCPWINSEFGSGPFSFPNGAVLAVDEPQMIYVDRETFKPISSCFYLAPNENVPSNEWQVDTSEDRVRISVSPALKERIADARNSKEKRSILLNSIYFGAVVQCLAILKNTEEAEDLRWARIFRQRLADQHLELDRHAETWLAQQLMRHPFSIVDRYFFGEAVE